MTSRFEKLLIDIAEAELGRSPDGEVIDQIRTILEEDGMAFDDQVPEWIVALFESLRDREPLAVHDQPSPTTDAEITEFFADLQDVEVFDCYDHGEWVRIRLPNLGMLGFFSLQHAYYTTERLGDVDDDGGSDLSVAKQYDR